MDVRSTEIGLVSTSEALFDFYVRALGGTRLEPRVAAFATVHRLDLGPVVLKVLVPNDAPAAPPPAADFAEVAGLRYLTFWVADLDAFVARWTASGGHVAAAARDLRPGVRFALLADPDANAVEALEETG